MKFMILGHTGFLGSMLVKKLEHEGSSVQILSRSFPYDNLEVKGILNEDEERTLISTAWISNRNMNYQASQLNYEWLARHRDIITFCKGNQFKLVLPGSCLEYVPDSKSPYVCSKRDLLEFLREAMSQNQFLWLRYFYIFSNEFRRPRLMREALESKDVGMQFRVGEPYLKHDYIEIRDAVRQTFYHIQKFNGGVKDVGTGKLRTNLDLVSRVNTVEIPDTGGRLNGYRQNASWHKAAKTEFKDDREMSLETESFFNQRPFPILQT